jgi:hypothetical protein
MNALTSILIKFGLLKDDLDYHLLRASMVIIFLAFGYQKWVGVRGAGADSIYQQRPSHFLDVPRFRQPRRELVLRRFRMADRRAPVPGVLEQEIGNSWRPWLMRYIRIDRHHHSVHAERLGSGCRVSGDGGQCSFSGEGCGSSGCIDLFAEAGCDEGVAFRRARR